MQIVNYKKDSNNFFNSFYTFIDQFSFKKVGGIFSNPIGNSLHCTL